MKSVTFTDLQGKPVLTWNAAGCTVYRYDVDGNLTSNTDELYRTTSWRFFFWLTTLNRLEPEAPPDLALTKNEIILLDALMKPNQ